MLLSMYVIEPRDEFVEAIEKTLGEWESEGDESAFHDL